MVYSARYNLFSADKRNFYSRFATTDPTKIAQLARRQPYRFIAENRFLIEQEFNQLFPILNAKEDSADDFWLYCYYCSIMLQKYYSKYAYNKPDQADKYRKLSAKLSYRCQNKRFKEEATQDDAFKQMFSKKITADLNSLMSTPKQTTKIRDWIGFFNIYRILFVFSRLAVKQTFLMANELLWFEKLEKLIGRHVNVDGMVSIIKAPTAIFNALSVSLFAARFILNSGVLLKHLLAPSYNEKSFSASERFYQELSKRHCVMLNDLVWGTINVLTNYSAVLNLSAPVASGLTAVFLLFDVSLLLYRQHLAEEEYLLKKSQYINDKTHYDDQFKKGLITYDEKQKHLKMLDRQLIVLDNNWQSTRASLSCNLTAAVLLMGGFTASLLLATPAGIAVSYLVCTIAVATYLSADLYGKYKEKAVILQKCKLGEMDDVELSMAIKEARIARNDFILAMFKNTFMPLLIVTTFAICWPAALVLTALYVGYESMNGYFKQSAEKTTPSLPSSAVDANDDVISEQSGLRRTN